MINLIITNYKRIVYPTLLSSFFIFVYLLFVAPVTFTSKVTLLPPDNTSKTGFSALLQGTGLTDLIGQGGTVTSQLLAEILKSRSVAMNLINKLDLINKLNADDLEDALKIIDKNLDIDVSKEGIITVKYSCNTGFFPNSDDKDSARVLTANIANSLVASLDEINRQKNSSKAKQARLFIEEQIKITKEKLDTAEAELQLFQTENKTISLTDQMKASIDAAAKIKAEIIAAEIQVGLLSQYLQEDNAMLSSLKSKINELNKQYSKIEQGDKDFFLNFKNVPNVGIKLTSLMREVRILNEVYLLLQQQFYKEIIQENKDIATVEVLDAAVPPIKQSSPRLIVHTFLATLIIFLILILSVIIQNKKMFKYLNEKS